MAQQPKFWARSGILPTLFAPLSALYNWMYLKRYARYEAHQLSVPVLCVGNLTVGGAGKTPTVIALLKRCQSLGINAHVLSRGYKGSLQGPVQVNPAQHSHLEVGDEPLLIARHAPCWVAKRRLRAAQAAIAAGAELLIMDDGLQNPTIEKNFSLLVVDGGYGFGNGKTMPAGPLREPLSFGLSKANAMLIIGEDAQNVKTQAQQEQPELPCLTANIAIAEDAPAPQKVVAFAGIGRPQKFYDSLQQAGFTLAETHNFADHHVYSLDDLLTLREAAAKHNAPLMTTEKDYVRLPEAQQDGILTLPIALALTAEGEPFITQTLRTLCPPKETAA